MGKKSILIALLIIVVIGVIVTYLITNKNNVVQTGSDVKESFSLKYNGVEITPGVDFDENAINKEVNISEIPSCAFEGIDKVYTYENVEITVAEINGKNIVYSVYFIDDSVETTEGVKITDNKDVMIDKYGNEYEELLENKYIYTKNNVQLSFIVENDVITGIEYELKTDN